MTDNYREVYEHTNIRPNEVTMLPLKRVDRKNARYQNVKGG